jgi:arylsulfatase A-like enzyme
MAPPHTHNSPLSSGKGSHHEGGIRVPLLVSWPGVTQPGTVSATPVMIYDWFPTLLKAAGCNLTATTDGLDLARLLRGGTSDAFDRPLVWHFPNFWGPLSAAPVEGPGMGPSSTIRRGDWKLIYYHGDQRFELFNLVTGLSETSNLAQQETHRVRQLAAELSDVLRRWKAPMPIVKASGQPVAFPDAALKP